MERSHHGSPDAPTSGRRVTHLQRSLHVRFPLRAAILAKNAKERSTQILRITTEEQERSNEVSAYDRTHQVDYFISPPNYNLETSHRSSSFTVT